MKLVYCSLLAAAAAFAQPSITSVENAASNIPPGLPNSGIARGSMFVVKGANLGPPSIVVAQSFPLPLTLAATSVSVTSAGQTVSAIMYYAWNRQVAAILPSSAVAGLGTVTVTYNNAASAAFPITIVPTNAAIFTRTSTGTGDAVVTLGNNTVVTSTNAPNPGEAVVLWATGVGPVNFDETRAAPGGDLTEIPLEAFVGGQPARVLYRGRNACCSSVDQINIELPQGISGCAVPVVLKTGNLVSNTATIPIAQAGRTCIPSNPGVTTGDISRLTARQNPVVGEIALARNTVSTGTPPIVTRSDTGSASFLRFTAPGFAVATALAEIPVPGTCTVTSFSGTSVPPPSANLEFQTLDAGPSMPLLGQVSNRTLERTNRGGVITYGGTLDPNAGYLVPGEYAVNGAGGPDIGAFTSRIIVPLPFSWANQNASTTVNRNQGLTVTWTGGDPNGFVRITGRSPLPNGSAAASFTCIARASQTSFQVPPAVLLAMPPSGTLGGIPVPGNLGVAHTVSAPFTAPGLDFGIMHYANSTTQNASYQ